MRIFALLLHGKVRVWSRTTLDPEVSNQARISIANDKLAHHIDTMVC